MAASVDVAEAELVLEGERSAETACEAVDGASLGKHEELGTNPGARCTCGPSHLRLRSDQGELVQPRGGCVNQCEYCAKLAAVENCEMLVLDALEGDAPQLLSILGTRTATLDMAAFKLARQRVTKLVRKRWPRAEYAYEVEFTTGYGPRAGGRRRPHWNWFWKGVPVADVDEFAELVIGTWCRYVDAEPQAQYVAPIDNAVGLTKYVTEHFMKESQRPPKGFTGQRFNCSHGYFGAVTRRTARARARDSLRSKRELWKALKAGHEGHGAELVAHQALKLANRTVWVLATDRGARVGETAYRPSRMVLPSDRLAAAASPPPAAAEGSGASGDHTAARGTPLGPQQCSSGHRRPPGEPGRPTARPRAEPPDGRPPTGLPREPAEPLNADAGVPARFRPTRLR